MTSCKLLLYSINDFRIFSGNLLSTEPLTVELPSADVGSFNDAVRLKLKWYENTVTHTAEVKLISVSDNRLELRIVSDVKHSESDSHFIEFKDHFEIVPADDGNIADLRYRAEKLNNRYKSTLTNQIKKIITDESLTNQYILKMLMSIDGKMDELLDSLKDEDTVEGITARKMLSLGGDGLSFVYDSCGIKPDDMVYVQSTPKTGSGLNFAAVCKITDVIPTGNTCICEAVFSNINDSTKENIIHFVFQKDRENLKRNRS
ncbi:hypothetical protein Dacet_2862 [Denitrovibrio acetiphilus DSM 12809]|uniref:Type IV pilus assembly PilZ n=1 Tax=Denitrovibrio acetiphilus (strain DSM 12809 / NBRC 114555 / N2460) TaxID=522772 RepID=D4H6D8_DENA2|nr:hypothetical protein [Denitrovibrio acetiphilus]ADD69612.1 hypothetical protein Dacet_2862 [Denitrovibrio acetiphilus DSM 12809]